jgi:hypothetical protein
MTNISRKHWLSPFPEDDIIHLVERALPGSDWPYLEGRRLLMKYLAQLGKLDTDRVRQIMGDNGLELLT